MPTKICFVCKLEKDVDDFQIQKKNNKYQRHPKCINCRRAYDNLYHFNRSLKQKLRKQKLQDDRKRSNTKIIQNYKASKGCCKCGENDWVCLDFHHIDNNKEFNVGDGSARANSIKTLMKEINKCIIICSNCHRKLHRDEKQVVAQR